MVTRVGGSRRKTRKKFKKNKNQKGKIKISEFFKEFEKGDKVILDAEPSYQKGMYHGKFHGKSGKITGKQGDCYKVEIKDGNKTKTIITHPIHLKEEQ